MASEMPPKCHHNKNNVTLINMYKNLVVTSVCVRESIVSVIIPHR